MGTLHAGDIRTSRRLQDTAAILRTAGAVGITTLGISRATGSCAVHSDIAGLRANGFVIEKKRERDTERAKQEALTAASLYQEKVKALHETEQALAKREHELLGGPPPAPSGKEKKKRA